MKRFNSLQELAQFLRSQASTNGAIQFAAPDLLSGDGVLESVQKYLRCDSFSLVVKADEIPDPVGDRLSFAARTPDDAQITFLNLTGRPVTQVSFTLVGETKELQFTFSVSLGAWSFQDSFPELQFTALPAIAPMLSQQSLLFDTQCARPLTFASDLDLSKSDTPLGGVLRLVPGAATALSVMGEIDQTTAQDAKPQALLDLRAKLKAPAFKLGGLLELQPPYVGIRSTYIVPPKRPDGTQPVPYLLSHNYVGTDVQVNSTSGQLDLAFEATIHQESNFATLSVRPKPNQDFNGSIGDLVTLVGDAVGGFDGLFSNDIARKFKEDFLDRIGFVGFFTTFHYNTGKFSALTLSFMSVDKQGKYNTWKPFGDALQIGFLFNWVILDPAKPRDTMLANLTANVTVGELPFQVNVSIPSMQIDGRYAGGPQTLRLVEAVKRFTGLDFPLPDDLLDLALDSFSFAADPQNRSFNFSLGGGADFRLFGLDLLRISNGVVTIAQDYQAIDPEANDQGAQPVRTLSLAGTIGILGLDFAVSAVISQDPEKDTVFEVHMVNQTVGSLLNYLVSLVDPYFKLDLEKPWNILLGIKLDALVLKVNVTKGAVYVTYETKVDLGFIKLAGIGLVYQRAMTDKKSGKTTPSSVQISLECAFLGQQYGGPDGDPLSWDPMNDPAPQVPANAPIFELNYLGLGQHVTPDTGDLTSMVEIIEAMQKAMVPADEATTNPAKLPGISFRADSQWLIAARFSVMGTVELIPIFNDPVLYGLRVALSGPQAGSFAGLDFEILYKKITPSIGLYHVALTLPAAMRQFEFGQVSVMLPSFALDIYTNGNFLVDFGFPKGLDFSQSFSVQVFPFLGFGGFYFGVLSSATTNKVPKISNGSFDPVVVFGLGLSIGVGKTIEKGVLRAGFAITVIGMLEGVVAWFKPDRSTVPAERYFYVKGAVGVLGQLFGKVDFRVISVSIQAKVYAVVSLTVAAHEPVYLMITAGISVEASIKILFIRIKFHFSTSITESFTIGHKTPTPWQVVEQGGGAGQKHLAAQPTVQAARRQVLLLGGPLTDGLDQHSSLTWTPVAVGHLLRDGRRLASRQAALLAAEDRKTPLPILLVPAFTQSNEAGAGPAVQAILVPFIENASSPDPDAPVNESVADAAEKPFTQLMAHLLAWAIHARLSSVDSPSPVVTAADLRAIFTALSNHNLDATGFTYENLVAFLRANFDVTLQVRPTSASEEDLTSATIFPVLPALTMSYADQQGQPQRVDFAAYTPVDADYQQQIDAYLHQLFVAYESSVAAGGTDSAPATDDRLLAGEPPSMAKILFQRYFVTLARSAVQAAIDHLESFSYTIPAGTSPSLQALATKFSTSETVHTTTGAETLQQVADSYGVLVSLIQQINPEVAGLQPGDSPPAGLDLVILQGALTEAVTIAGDTLQILATRYQVPVPVIVALNAALRKLSPTAPIAAGTRVLLPVLVTPESILMANQDSKGLPKQGAAMPLSGVDYLITQGDSFDAIANRFMPGDAAYRSTLLTALADQPVLQVGTSIAFGPGAISAAFVTRDGDSPGLVALLMKARLLGPALFGLVGDTSPVVANIIAAAPPPEQPGAILGPNTPILPGTTLTFAMPDNTEVTYVTNALDTPRLIAAYFLAMEQGTVNYTDLLGGLYEQNDSLAQVAPADPLTPGTVLTLPKFKYQVQTGDSLTRIRRLVLPYIDLLPGDQKEAEVAAVLDRLATIDGLPATYASLTIPTFTHTIAEGDTLATIARAYNLSFDGLTRAIADAEGLLADQTGDGKPVVVTIPRVPARHTADLVNDLVEAGDFNHSAGMLSRFLLHGLRLPVKGAAPDVTAPMYGLTGQQFTLAPTAGEGYEIGLEGPHQADWLSFRMSSFHAAKGATPEGLAARFAAKDQAEDFKAQLVKLNPDVTFPLAGATWLNFPADMDLTAGAISFSADEAAQVAGLRRATFTPDAQAPQPLPLYREAPDRHALQQRIPWQPALMPDLKALTDTSSRVPAPTVWPFPTSLQQAVDSLESAAAVYPTFELMVGTQESPSAPMTTRQAEHYVWGTRLDVRIQQVPGPEEGGSPTNTYMLVGTDEAGRQRIQDVWSYLSGEGKGADVKLCLLYEPTGQSSGLRSDALNADATHILRTNLSTLSQSGPAMLGAALQDNPPIPAGIYDAALAAPNDFLKLLWECSVVYSGGYYLTYTTADGGALPGDLFTENTEVTLSLLILIDDPDTDARHPKIGRMHNCTVLLDAIDASKSSLFVQPITYIVPKLGSLSAAAASINREYSLTLDAGALALANAKVRGLLQIGQTLTVPNQQQPYTIIYGDTLGSIGARYGIDAKALIGLGENAEAAILAPGALLQIAPDQLHAVAAVPPGNAGFSVERTEPATDGVAPTADQSPYLDNLYQLLAYHIAPTARFVKTAQGLPAGPVDGHHDASDGLKSLPKGGR